MERNRLKKKKKLLKKKLVVYKQILRVQSLFLYLLLITPLIHSQERINSLSNSYLSDETSHNLEETTQTNKNLKLENRIKSFKRSIASLEKSPRVQLLNSALNLNDIDAEDCCNCVTPSVCPGEEPAAKRAKKLAKSKKQKMPKKIKHVYRKNLNRFYYLRSCDTPESLAKFIYGTEKMAKRLIEWNGAREKWQAGKIIYFRDPFNSEAKMKAFFDVHPPTLKEYTVKKGDSLQSIAFSVFGDIKSWKEIAARNNIKSPDSLRKGQKLLVEYFN